MLKNKKITIIVSVFAIISICLSLGLILLNQSNSNSSKRSDFPLLEPSPFMSIKEIAFEEQVEASDLIVEATVNRVYPVEQQELIPPEGSPEAKALGKNGINKLVYNSLTVEMKAGDYLKGDAEETFEVTIVGFGLDSSPEFKVGDQYLLTLYKNLEGGYSPVTPVSSYFFIADDNKIYPGGNDVPTLKYSGMDLTDAKRDIASVAEKTKMKG